MTHPDFFFPTGELLKLPVCPTCCGFKVEIKALWSQSALINFLLLLFLFQAVLGVAGVDSDVVEDLEAAVVEVSEVDAVEEASEEEEVVVDVDSEVGPFFFSATN